MKDDETSPNQRPVTGRLPSDYRRRKVLTAAGGLGAALLAGCVGDSPSSDEPGTDTDEPDDGTESSSTFRLLISDAPADIGDFDRLDVTFDSARIFDGGGDEEDDENETEETEETATETPEETAESTETEGTPDEEPTETETEEEDSDEDDSDEDGDGDRGFYTLELDDVTVDLTQVVGDKAMPVFDGELETGTYQKIELNVASTEGIVDGEPVDVKVPSEKLQITKPFEIRAGESLEFVFDINVVKRGQDNGYILKPVISQSGVNGEDVEVEEVGEDDEDEDEDDDEDEEETETPEETEEAEETETPADTESPTATPQETNESSGQ